MYIKPFVNCTVAPSCVNNSCEGFCSNTERVNTRGEGCGCVLIKVPLVLKCVTSLACVWHG